MMNSWVRAQASAEASMKSACRRSKKLCGAPGYVIMVLATPAPVSASSKAVISDAGMPSSAPPQIARIGDLMSSARWVGPGAPKMVPGKP